MTPPAQPQPRSAFDRRAYIERCKAEKDRQNVRYLQTYYVPGS